MDHHHSPDAIARRLDEGPRLSYVRDWVYGGIDGAVTTFAVVAGVEGAHLSVEIIVILGVANLVGDGFSMAAANYSGTRAERQEYEHFEAMELRHIEEEPEGEREEIRQIFRRKGFAGDELETVVNRITSDRDLWLRTMLHEEHGLPMEIRSPLRAATATFSAFMVCGAVPLLPYVVGGAGFALSAAFTALAFFAVGSAKSRWSITPWWRSGLETLVIGSIAASLAFGIGRFLRSIV